MPDPSDSGVPATESTGRPRRLRRKLLLAGGVALIGVVVLLLWTRTTASTSFCSKCHVMDVAIDSASKSIHADVPCISCHVDGGAKGALRYIPSLVREVVQEATGWHTARGVLGAKSCTSCHKPRKAPVSGEVAAGESDVLHPDPASSCTSCHGDVAHPGRPEPAAKGHPDNYQQVHGRDVSRDGREKCATCHEEEFCRSCHVDDPEPHPADWMTTHGAVQTAEGSSCTMCHAPATFCKACHGTEIPHPPGWLASHPAAAAAADQTLCATCHARQACDLCHEEHGDHRRQAARGGP